METRESVNELVDHTVASIAGGRLECASDIVMLRASELAHAIKCRDVSCCEVMQAYLKHIDRLNPIVHALRLGVEQAELIALAYHRDTQLRRGEYLGWMHGLPTVIRENRDAAACALVARRMKNAGCIIVGEANQSLSVSDCDCEYRPVAMPLNAYDQRKTAGGGAASAAVALALRMLPVADGSDPAVSLQNACAFNNVLGFRPSAGRTLPETQQLLAPTFAARGLMARSVRDLARLFLVQSGYNDLGACARREDLRRDAKPGRRVFEDSRVAWFGDLGGQLAIDPSVTDVCDRALCVLESLGCRVERVCPIYPFECLWRAWRVLRGLQAQVLTLDPGQRRNARSRKLSGWNGECGCSRCTDDIFDAVVAHRAWCNALKKLFDSYEFVILPAAQVFPFDVALEWPQRIAGRAIESCEDCWRVTIPIIMTGCPTVTVPVGFDGDGLPMGMQIIARHGADITCLELASAYEAASSWIEARLPSLLRARVSKEAPKA